MYIVGLQDDNIPKRGKTDFPQQGVTGEQYAVKNDDGSTTIHYANGKTETIQPLFQNQGQQVQLSAEKSSQMVEVGDRYAVLNDDGSTTVYYANGKTETIPPSKDDLQSEVEEMPKDEIKNDVSSENEERANSVKKFTPYLDKLAGKLNDINTNRKQYSAGEFVEKRNELIKNVSIQKMLNECLGKPGKGLTQTGRIRTENGTVLSLSSRKDIHSGEYYWDITYSSVKAE